jgi:Mu-like prophage I protein
MLPRPAPDDILTTTAAAGSVLRLSRTGGGELDLAAKAELLEKLHAGARVPAMRFDALTFLQSEKTNRNHVRFSEAALQRLAKSFVGRPFLRDHAQEELAARGGTIVASELVDLEGGAKGLRQTIEAVKPWAQEGLLDGTISTFSIGWSRNVTKEPLCTVCESPMFSRDCSHFPGDVATLKDGRQITCERLYTDVDGVEVSAVNFPAVRGTGVEGIRAALSAFRAQAPEERRSPMLTSLSKILGCSEEDTAVLDAARGLKAKHDGLAAAHAEATTALNEARAKLEALEVSARTAALETLIEEAKREGKILPKLGDKGERLESDLEKSVRALSAISFDGAKAFVGQLPRVGPQAKAQRTDDPPPPEPRANVGKLNDAEKKIAHQMGVTDEQYLKFKAERYEADRIAANAKDKE